MEAVMKWAGLLADLAAFLTDHGVFQPQRIWVLGVSGGPDSTLLLHAMHALSRERDLGWRLHAAHLHHGLRGADADADMDFVEKLAEELGIPFHGERAELAGEGGGEEAARNRRYDFLQRVALTVGAEQAAVAHHADDDAETIFHRICRGTGLRGLAGMRAVRPIQPGSRVLLVRPFLHQRRARLMDVVTERALAYRQDATNLQPEANTRANIRNRLLPLLARELNPNVHEAILRLGEQARWLGDYLQEAAARTFDSLIVAEQHDHIALNVRALLAKPKIIQAAVVRHAILVLLGGENDLSFNHVDAVLRLAGGNVSGKELHLPGSIVVRKIYDKLEFHPRAAGEAVAAEFIPVFCEFPGCVAVPTLRVMIAGQVCELDADAPNSPPAAGNPYEEWIDLERVQPPLFVRSRRDGDRFWPLGAPGTKTISDFLSDVKVAPELRARTGVLCDQSGPIWVMPLRIDERVKLRPTSRRALRLVLTPIDADGRPAANNA